MFVHSGPRFVIYFGSAQEQLYKEHYQNFFVSADATLNTYPYSSIKNNIPSNDLVFYHQVHGNQGHEIVDNAVSIFSRDGDYLLTKQPIALGVLTADCLPIVFYDAQNHAVAIAHAGWRGSVQEIAIKTVEHMQRSFNTSCDTLQIFLGPSARACCYEVSDDFIEHLKPFSYGLQALSKRESKLYFDGALFNQLQLQAAGISANQINIEYNLCTMCDHRFFSHRRQAEKAGRQMSVVCLKV